MIKNHYETLGLDPQNREQITQREITVAYHRKSRQIEIDDNEKRQEINEAYVVLSGSDKDQHGIKGVLAKIGAMIWIYVPLAFIINIFSLVLELLTPSFFLAMCFLEYTDIHIEITDNPFESESFIIESIFISMLTILRMVYDNPISSLLRSIGVIAFFGCGIIGIIKLTPLVIAKYLIMHHILTIYLLLSLGGVYQQFVTEFYAKLHEGHVLLKCVIGFVTAVVLLAAVLLMIFPPIGLQLYITMLTTAMVFGTIVTTLAAAVTIIVVAVMINVTNHELSSTAWQARWQARMSIIAPIAIIFALAAACIIIFPPAGVLPFISVLAVNLGIESFAVTTLAAMAAGIVALAVSSISIVGCAIYDTDFRTAKINTNDGEVPDKPGLYTDNYDNDATTGSNASHQPADVMTTGEQMAAFGMHAKQQNLKDGNASHSHTPLPSDSIN